MRPWLALARATRFAARRSLCSAPPPLTVGRSVARTEDGARWVASIDVDGTAYRIGEFDTEDAATLAWDEWNALVASVDEQGSSVVAAAPLSEAWSPPAKAEEEEEEEDAAWDALPMDSEPAAIGVEPSVADVVRVLTRLNAVELVEIDISRRCDWATHMVIVTGRSLAHMRKMADALVADLKRRELDELNPGVEDRHDDEWMAVDAGDVIVHVFEEEARARFDLESHWGGPEEEWPGTIYEETSKI